MNGFLSRFRGPLASLPEFFQAMVVPSDALLAIDLNPLCPRGSNTSDFLYSARQHPFCIVRHSGSPKLRGMSCHTPSSGEPALENGNCHW